MCEYFVKADPIQYEQRTRTIRIHGVLTSIRLENLAWDTLAEMAEEQGCTTNSLIVQFHDEILAHRGEVPNFASFLRVTCMRYLRRRLTAAERGAEGRLVADPDATARPRAPRIVSLDRAS
jgi:predicted DNA-binding ribbon-helix-helix protein